MQTSSIKVNEDGQTVTFHTEIRRRVKNITDGPQTRHFGLAIDDWGFEGLQSRIIRLAYQRSEKEWVTVPSSRFAKSKTGDAWIVEPEEQVLYQAGEEVEEEAVFEEIKRINDVNHMVFSIPTRHPRVFVRVQGPLAYRVGYGHRAQAKVVDNPGGSYRLTGTLLPQQQVEIRWWRR